MRTLRAALAALFAIACGSSPADPSTAPAAALGQPTKLGMGQAASFDSGRFELGLRQVLEDSRCPADALCIQAGAGRLAAWVVTATGRREAELRTDAWPSFDGYAVQVTALEPYPYSNIRIDPSKYVATVIVTRR
ncbi:MAG: hypothetical protein NDJ94_05490 [Vicinamibacteria bacterium]|nr:hypothetical protein [Vicinamibacteria bacterium]